MSESGKAPPRHRGPRPGDRLWFADAKMPALRSATEELSWLLSRGYPIEASLKLVGDRHDLVARQRFALRTAAASEEDCRRRAARRVAAGDLRGERVAIDGFNAIITAEAAVDGAVIVACRDTALRDLSSVHSTYRTVEGTRAAAKQIGEVLARHEPREVTWYLDRPVSNSGRLATRLRKTAATRGWPWHVELVDDADTAVADSGAIAVSSDGEVLDRSARWYNLSADLVAELGKSSAARVWLIDLAAPASGADER